MKSVCSILPLLLLKSMLLLLRSMIVLTWSMDKHHAYRLLLMRQVRHGGQDSV